jgi:hypothetical protein
MSLNLVNSNIMRYNSIYWFLDIGGVLPPPLGSMKVYATKKAKGGGRFGPGVFGVFSGGVSALVL